MVVKRYFEGGARQQLVKMDRPKELAQIEVSKLTLSIQLFTKSNIMARIEGLKCTISTPRLNHL